MQMEKAAPRRHVAQLLYPYLLGRAPVSYSSYLFYMVRLPSSKAPIYLVWNTTIILQVVIPDIHASPDNVFDTVDILPHSTHNP